MGVCEPALLHDNGAAAGAVGGHGQRAALDSHVVGHTHEVDATVRDLGTGSGWLMRVVWTAVRERNSGRETWIAWAINRRRLERKAERKQRIDARESKRVGCSVRGGYVNGHSQWEVWTV